MGFRLWLIGLVLALATVAECSSSFLGSKQDFPMPYTPGSLDSIEMLMDSEINRRQLAAARYISYGALRKNSIPCNRRGHSYYNCSKQKRANPYRRGCSVITHCKRFTN
ncbi:protein RALF-like 19 [Punica granatum]|uniref:Uncharacterized protein n=2 Tax=Punica granatum TaxID=22663 RepID=A0A2I0LFL1_PUNGR|nr:protein RALF-like 19 [Punica granatum]PKI79477.1 hypothetical protein CRG98_000108 [Punica granatum]